MTAEYLAAMVAVAAFAYFVITGALTYRSGSHFKRIARTEQTRTCWAEARNLLVLLMREGKLDPRSETFRTFYGVTTFVLRRPDQYEEIAAALAKAFLVMEKGKERKWRHEMRAWPEEMTVVLGCINAGVDSLMLRHKGWRILAPLLVRWLGYTAAETAFGIPRRVFQRIRKRILPMAHAYLIVRDVHVRVGRLAESTARYQLAPLPA